MQYTERRLGLGLMLGLGLGLGLGLRLEMVRVRIRIRVSGLRWIASSAHSAILGRFAMPSI